MADGRRITRTHRAFECGKGNEQYFVNVCLKINAKLGGINVIPKPDTVRFLTDPTIVIGADVEHPGPRNMTRPSYSAVTGSVDSDATKYVAVSRAQPCRREMIDDLTDMVADFEVVQIFKACDRVGIPRPKLTFVVVGKRHHIRFFPLPGGNAPAGLVVDREITSSVEYEFYLQSHGGLLGTSRSAHYNVLVDENDFMPDDIQRISFSFCHVYARATRSVSIVPPVYYADTVCGRAKHHYDPDGGFGAASDSASVSTAAGTDQAESFRRAYQPVHENTGQHMYFQ